MIVSKPPQQPAHPRLALVVGVLLACGLLTLVSLVTGCGSSPSGETSATQVPGTAADVTTTEAPVTAATVATGVVDTWTEAMQKLVGVLEGAPRADAIRAEVEGLKEKYVQRLVAFGRQRSELTTTEQDEMSALIFLGINALAAEPWYVSYTSLYKQYSTGDLEFANLLASFNILTQYADFKLLKQQAPEEAARLGIE
jgi:hypothetical protein